MESDCQKSIVELNSELKKIKEENLILQKTIQEQKNEINILNYHLDNLTQKITAIYFSASWRLTYPFRWLKIQKKKFIKKFFKPSIKTDYQKWIKKYDTLTHANREKIKRDIVSLPQKPFISLILTLDQPVIKQLCSTIKSIRQQLYPNWELWIVNAGVMKPTVHKILDKYCQQDSRIKVNLLKSKRSIALAFNNALELVTGDFTGLVKCGDKLSQHALYHVNEKINQHSDAELLYSDEDKINKNHRRSNPHFKTDWNPDLFHSYNMISCLSVYRTYLLKTIGGFQNGYEDSEEYDLALRAIEKIKPTQIHHIPHILYHHLEKIPSKAEFASGKKALQHFFERKGIMADVVEAHSEYPAYRVKFPLPEVKPRVSIILPTKDRLDLLEKCVASIFAKTDYLNYELIIINNQSVENKTLWYLEDLRKIENVKIRDFDKPFNYSSICNFAVHNAIGEIVLFLNNDTEVISPHWLSEMVSHAVRQEIGMVGCKLLYPNHTIQHGGVIGFSRHAHIGFPSDNFGYFGRAILLQNFLAVTGACMALRRSIFDEVGGFDENLPVNFNDVDLCLRVHKLGYRNLWTPYACLYHHESSTLGNCSSIKNEIQGQRDNEYMKKKWGALLLRDPFYNPNLSLDYDFLLAFPPRGMCSDLLS